MTDPTLNDEWEYDAYRLGRVTRTVEVADPDGGVQTIEEGTIRFETINKEDQWLWEEDDWLTHMVAGDGGIGLTDGVVVPHERVGIIEIPEPMTAKEADEWLESNPDQWRELLDDTIASDVTASDILEELR